MSINKTLLYCWISLITAVSIFYGYMAYPDDQKSSEQENIQSASNHTKITGYDMQGKKSLSLTAKSMQQSAGQINASSVEASLSTNSIYRLQAKSIHKDTNGLYLLNDAVVSTQHNTPCLFELSSAKLIFDPVNQFLYSDNKIILKYDDIITHMIGGRIDIRKQEVQLGKNIFMQANPITACQSKLTEKRKT